MNGLPIQPRADRLIVVAGDHFDHHARRNTPPLLTTDSPERLAAVWAMVTDWDPASPRDTVVMEPVLLTLCFLQGRSPVATVGLKSSTATSDLWRSFDRSLRTSALHDWLTANNVILPWPT